MYKQRCAGERSVKFKNILKLVENVSIKGIKLGKATDKPRFMLIADVKNASNILLNIVVIVVCVIKFSRNTPGQSNFL